MNSDHVPIIVKISKEAEFLIAESKTFVNFAKSDWSRLKEQREDDFAILLSPTTAIKGESNFRRILRQDGNRCIPAGRLPTIRTNFPREAAQLADERDERKELHLNVGLTSSIRKQ